MENYSTFQKHLTDELTAIKDAGLYKEERIIVSPQSVKIRLNNNLEVLNFCANNYLGLSDNQGLIDAAEKAMKERGYGMSDRKSTRLNSSH